MAERAPRRLWAGRSRALYRSLPRLAGSRSAGTAKRRGSAGRADGCIALADGGRFYVEGMTAPEIARAAADRLGLPPEQVRVGVVEYNSQQLYLFGERPAVSVRSRTKGRKPSWTCSRRRRPRAARRSATSRSCEPTSPTALRRNFSRSISRPSCFMATRRRTCDWNRSTKSISAKRNGRA